MAKMLKYFIKQMLLKEFFYVYYLDGIWDSIEEVFLLVLV